MRWWFGGINGHHGGIFFSPLLTDNCQAAYYTDRNCCIAVGQTASPQPSLRPASAHPSRGTRRQQYLAWQTVKTSKSLWLLRVDRSPRRIAATDFCRQVVTEEICAIIGFPL